MGSTPDGSTTPLDDVATAFAGLRGRLFGIAYRVLGTAAEAEDVVQDAWLRWQATDRSAVLDPAAFLATTTTRLAINVAQSARARREEYVGPWLPEPVDTSADPALGAERSEALEGVVEMQMEGGKKVTLHPGQTFYEDPAGIHLVGRNVSDRDPAKFIVFLVKNQGAPLLVPVNR